MTAEHLSDTAPVARDPPPPTRANFIVLLFLYGRHVLGLRSPATRATLKGIAVHEVLSKFFERPMESRDLEHLHELFLGVMTKLIAEGKTVRTKRPVPSTRVLFRTIVLKAVIESLVTIRSTRLSSWSRCGTCGLLFLFENRFPSLEKRTLLGIFLRRSNLEGLRSRLRRQNTAQVTLTANSGARFRNVVF